jgi:hypothetical protein
MNESTKKKFGAVAVTSVLLVGTGVAAAYWTAGGTGSGTATTGSVQQLKVVQMVDITGLAPGSPAVTLEGHFDNMDANHATVRVEKVTAEVTGVEKATGAPTGTCGVSDYTITDPAMPVAEGIPHGMGVGSWSGAKIAFNNKSDVNQDACKGATVEITYTVS